MIIGLRAGHSDNCTGAVGIVNEHDQMKLYYAAVKNVLEMYGHTVINCNSNANTENGELSEGARIANDDNNKCELFISLHMNASDSGGHGTEVLVSSASSKAYPYAQKLVSNFAELGFTNRGVKFVQDYEMNHINCGNIISEICFCDSQIDIDIFNKYSWEQLAYTFCNAIDSNIPKSYVSIWNIGWNQDATGWWYSPNPFAKTYYKDSWENINGEWYSFNHKGYARESEWFKDKLWYYLKVSCKMAKSEWLWIDGECYCFDYSGALYINCKTPDGYYVDENGAWFK